MARQHSQYVRFVAISNATASKITGMEPEYVKISCNNVYSDTDCICHVCMDAGINCPGS